MGHERWFRGQHDGRERPFDWLTAARQHGIPDDLARVLYEQAVRQAHGATQGVAQDLYLALLADACRDGARPSPGKVTRTMRLQAHRAAKRQRPHISRLTGQPIAPGKRTLTSYLEPAAHEGRPSTRSLDEQVQPGKARAVPSEATRSSMQDIMVPGTVAYRQFRANLAAAFGHFEELDALEEGISPEPMTVMEASPTDANGEQPSEPGRMPLVDPVHGFGIADRDVTMLTAKPLYPLDERGVSRGAPAPGRSPRAGLPGDPDVLFDRATSGSAGEVPYRHEMERAFGADFSSVRVHLGRDVTLAGLGARAATRGEEIAFATAVPERELVAHELAHVLQARRGGSASSEDRVSRPGDPAEEEAARAARDVTAARHPARFSPPARRQSAAAAQIRLDRQPDISHRGLHTFHVGFGDHGRVMALQVGVSPGDARVTLKVASLSTGLLNPGLPQRMMPVSIHRDAALRPRLVREQQNVIQQSRDAESHECIMELALNDDPAVPHIMMISRYGRARAMAPVPSESLGGAHRPVMVESGFFTASDGFNDISVTFQSDNPGTFWSTEYRPFVHPRLGFGYLHVATHRFHPGPMPTAVPDPAAIADMAGEIARFGIHLIPVIGPLVMVGEALTGYSITGHRLGTLERALLGAGAVLSVIGPVIRVGARAVEVAATANRLAASSGISRLQALQLITGARRLTPVETARIEALSQAVRSGRALAAEEQTALSRILGKLAEPQRVATARAEVAARTGAASQAGRFTDLGTVTSAEEARVGEALARGLRADVIRIPEATASGVRTGDYVINDAMAELYSPTTSSLRNLLSQAASKHKQAATLIIDLTRSSLARSEAGSIAPRLFGRPECADLDRIIFIEGETILRVVIRPAARATSGGAGAAIRGGASAGSQAAGEEER